jgi:hypothetical protein
MSNPQERQAGTSGPTMGYEKGQGRGQGYETERGTERGYAPPAARRAEPRVGPFVGTALAGTLMVLGGLWSVIVGLVGLSTSHVFIVAPPTGYTYYWTYHGWGWVQLILGIVVVAAGVCVFLGMTWARYVGAGLAVLSAIAQFMLIPYTPIWSIMMIFLDAFILWALLAPRRTAGEV